MKKYIISIVTAAALLAGTAGIASAHGMFGAKGSAELSQALATRFNLNVADVQAFFREQAAAKLKIQLDKAVTAGKITAAQEQLIIAKLAEVQTKIEALQGTTDKAALKTALKAIQDDLKSWATTNNIPTGFLHEGMGKIGKAHMGMRAKIAK